MKRLLSLIVAFALLIACAPAISLQGNATTSGDYIYRLADGGAIITYYDRAISGEVTIPSTLDGYPVTGIGDYGFAGCNMTRIEIPNSVTSIGPCAFQYCPNLESIVIPDSVTTISNQAFENCANLKSVVIGDGVTTIGNSAFTWCTSLENVVIGDSVTTIGDDVFNQCSSLTEVVFGNRVESIGTSAFSDCASLESIEFPDSFLTIGNYAFMRCTGLTSIEIPDSVISMGNYTFEGCTDLTNVVIGDGVTGIGPQVFKDCASLASVVVGDSVTSIGHFVFYGCSNLTDIKIPNSVTSIGPSAFGRCSSLTDVYYGGTEEQKANIAIDSGNDPLLNANWVYAAPAVCEYLETGKEAATKYKTLEEALTAATSGTIKLLADTTVDTVILKSGVILDLNGHTLTADMLIVMNGATVLDGGTNCTGGGKLHIAKEKLLFVRENGQSAIPVWNGTDGYVLTKVTFQQMARPFAEGSAQYIFLPGFSNAEAAALLADGGGDNGIQIKVGLTWAGGQCQQFYTYEDAFVEQVFSSNGGLAFSLTVTGIAGITDMVANARIVTDSYAQVSATGIALVAG